MKNKRNSSPSHNKNKSKDQSSPFGDPYTVEDLVSEIKIMAKRRHPIFDVMGYINLRTNEYMSDPTQCMCKEDSKKAEIFYLTCLIVGRLPVGHEHKNGDKFLKEITCSKYFTEEELMALFGMDENGPTKESISIMHKQAQNNPHHDNFAVNDLAIAIGIIDKIKTELKCSIDEAIERIMNTSDKKQIGYIMPYLLFTFGFLPNGYDNKEKAFAEASRILEAGITFQPTHNTDNCCNNHNMNRKLKLSSCCKH